MFCIDQNARTRVISGVILTYSFAKPSKTYSVLPGFRNLNKYVIGMNTFISQIDICKNACSYTHYFKFWILTKAKPYLAHILIHLYTVLQT